MEKEINKKSFEIEDTKRILNELQGKNSRKRKEITIIIILSLMIVIVFLGIASYFYFKSPEKTIGLGAEIESFLISDDGLRAFVRMSGGSLDKNITAIKFTFSDSFGNNYFYETGEGIVEMEMPYERSFWDWLLGREFEERYDHEILISDVEGLDSFDKVDTLSLVFEHETEDGDVVDSPELDTEGLTTTPLSFSSSSTSTSSSSSRSNDETTGVDCILDCSGLDCDDDGCGGICEVCQFYEHPFLIFKADDLDSIKLKSTDSTVNEFGFSYKGVADRIEDTAKNYVNNPYSYDNVIPCLDTGDTLHYVYVFSNEEPPRHEGCRYPPWTRIAQEIETRLVYFSLAWLITENVTYAEHAKEMLIALSNWTVWSDPDYSCFGNSCLDNGRITRGSAIGYDALYDYLTKSEKIPIRKSIINKGLDPLYHTSKDHLNFTSSPNGYITLTSALGLGSLSIFQEENVSIYLSQAIVNSEIVIGSMSPEGSLLEGFAYGSFIYYIFEFINSLKNVDADYEHLLDYSFINNLPDYLITSSAPFFNFPIFADGGGAIKSNIYPDILLWYIGFNHSKKQDAANILFKSDPDLSYYFNTLSWFDEDIQVGEPNVSSGVFEEAGISILRKGWDSTNPFLAFKSSNKLTDMHEHLDINSFVLSLVNKWMLIDPGYIAYVPTELRTYGISTLAHNSIIIDGKGQSNSSAGDILDFYTSDSYDYVVGEANETYPSSLDLNEFKRHILFLKQDPEFFIIYDELNSDQIHNYSLLFHTKSAIEENDLMVNIYDVGSRVDIKTISSSNLDYEIISNSLAKDYENAYSKITTKEKKNQEHFLSVVYPYTTNWVNLSFENQYELELFDIYYKEADYFNDCSESVSGLCSLRVDDPSISANTRLYTDQMIKINSSKDYIYSTYVKSEDGSQVVYFGLIYYDSKFDQISYNYPVLSGDKPPTSWTKYESVMGPSGQEFPPGTEYVKLVFYGGYVNSQGSVWFDEIVFEEQDSSHIIPEIIVDNDIIRIKYENKEDIILFNQEKTTKSYSFDIGEVETNASICILRGNEIISYEGNCSITPCSEDSDCGEEFDLTDNVLILYNENTLEGLEIAEYYADAREINYNQICGVQFPPGSFATADQLLGVRKTIIEDCICNLVSEDLTGSCELSNINEIASVSPITHLAIIRGIPARLTGTGWDGDYWEPSLDYYLSLMLYRDYNVFEQNSDGRFPKPDYSGEYNNQKDFQPGDITGSHATNEYIREINPVLDKFLAYGRIEAMTKNRTFELIDKTINAENKGISGNFLVSISQFTKKSKAFDLFRELSSSLDAECGDYIIEGGTWNYNKCKAGATIAEIPGEPLAYEIPLAINAGVYLGEDSGPNLMTAFDGFYNMMNWRKTDEPCTTLCQDFPIDEQELCRENSKDYFKEINTDCVGVADGFLGFQLRSYPVEYYGFWPNGWDIVAGGNGEKTPPIILSGDAYQDSLFTDDKYLHYGALDAVANPECSLEDDNIESCSEIIGVNLKQNITLNPKPYIDGTRDFTVRFRHKSPQNENSLIKVQLLYYFDGGGHAYSSSKYIDISAEANDWKTEETVVTLTNNGKTITRMYLFISSQFSAPITGWLDLDGFEFIDVETTTQLANLSASSFNLSYIGETKDGDYAANVIDRLGGIGWWGSSSHFLTSGFAFSRTSKFAGAFYSGRSLGEALAYTDNGMSGIIYGDPLYNPSGVKIYIKDWSNEIGGDVGIGDNGYVFLRNNLPISVYINAFHGKDRLDTTNWNLFICYKNNITECEINNEWSEIRSGNKASFGLKVIDNLEEFINDFDSNLNLTMKLVAWNLNNPENNLTSYTYFYYEPDTDNDGLADKWEMYYFGDLLNNAEDDPDEDNFYNIEEYESFKRPLSEGNYPKCYLERHCPDDKPICKDFSECIACLSDLECGEDKPNCFNENCVECIDDTGCSDNLNALYCDSYNKCVECIDDTGCGGDTPRCINEQCVDCVDDNDCLDNIGFPYCIKNNCVECISETDCLGDDYCWLDNNCKRISCVENSDCEDFDDCSYDECVGGYCEFTKFPNEADCYYCADFSFCNQNGEFNLCGGADISHNGSVGQEDVDILKDFYSFQISCNESNLFCNYSDIDRRQLGPFGVSIIDLNLLKAKEGNDCKIESVCGNEICEVGETVENCVDDCVSIKFYVSTNGDDSNLGTIDNPFATIQKARDMIRARGTDGNEVYIREGTYYLSEYLEFDNQDSGSADASNVYTAYPGENVIISGGEKINFEWTDIGGGIFKTNIGNLEFRQLYVNKKRATRARTESKSIVKYEPIVPGQSTGGGDCYTTGRIIINKTDIEGYDLSEAEMHAHRKFMFLIANIKSIDSVNPLDVSGDPEDYRVLEFEQDETDILVGQAKRCYRDWYFLENSLDFLDEEGEWFLSELGDLYYMPINSEDVNSAEFIIPVIEQLVYMDNVSYVDFNGIEFKHTTWMRPSNHGFIGVQTGVYQIGTEGYFNDTYMPPSGFYIKNSNEILIYNSTFENFGGNGIGIGDNSENIHISRSHVSDISGNGINVYDFYENSSSWPRNYVVNHVNNITIKNSRINDIGKEFYHALGIFVAYAKNTNISNNEIYNVPYTAIDLGWRYEYGSSNNTISNSDIFNFSQKLTEGGGIYTLIRNLNSTLTGNYVHDLKVHNLSEGSTAKGTVAGFFFDDYSDGIKVYNNLATIPTTSILEKSSTRSFWAQWAWNDQRYGGIDFDVATNYNSITGHEDIVNNAGPQEVECFEDGDCSSGKECIQTQCNSLVDLPSLSLWIRIIERIKSLFEF